MFSFILRIVLKTEFNLPFYRQLLIKFIDVFCCLEFFQIMDFFCT